MRWKKTSPSTWVLGDFEIVRVARGLYILYRDGWQWGVPAASRTKLREEVRCLRQS